MKRFSMLFGVIVAVLIAATGALAQTIPPGGSQFNPPPPAPPPPPKIEVPVVPKMDAPMRQNATPAPRPSFGDRITTCLDEGTAAGLGPSERAAYSRSCANR
jgi:hypothetical protein